MSIKIAVVLATVAILGVSAAPKASPQFVAAPAPFAVAAAPAVAPAVVTSTSSQVIARNFNALAPVAAPVVAAYSAPIVAAPAVLPGYAGGPLVF